MSALRQLYKKKVLVIDDLDTMRQQMRQSMTGSGCERLAVVHNIQSGLELLGQDSFDVILCDFYLGDNTSGQQFLEYIRTRDLVSRNTLFVMLTAEQAYQKVVQVAECAPDDYLLKPFTAAQLNTRLERLLDKQAHLAAVNKATDQKNWKAVIAECDKLIAGNDRYVFDALKIKGAALAKAGRHKEAVEHFSRIVASRPLVWAKFGLARSQEATGDYDNACKLLDEIIAEAPHYMAAYDLLAKIKASRGEQQQAMDVLQAAGKISPGTMGRLRTLGTLAVSLGQNALAETVMSQALEDNKYSPVRDVQDFALLSRALVNQDKPDAALNLVKQARRAYHDETAEAVLSATECLAYKRAGDDEKANEALQRALAVNVSQMSPEVAMSVAEAGFAAGRRDEALALVKQVIQNNPDDAALHHQVQSVLSQSVSEKEAGALVESIRREIIALNNEGVRKAEAGELKEAIQLLSTAAERLPNNLQILGNAALAIAQHLVRNGKDPELMKDCLRYRAQLESKESGHPKLAQIDSLLARLGA